MRSSVEEIISIVRQEGGSHVFRAEDDHLTVLQEFQATYDLLLDLEYQGVLRITARERELHAGRPYVSQVAVSLIRDAQARAT